MNKRPFDPATERYVSLATFRRNGTEVRTPVWIAEADRRYYVFSEGSAWKVKRIRANTHAKLAACGPRGEVQSDWMDAEGRIVDDSEVVANAYKALRTKYGWQMKILDVFSKLSGRYGKRAVIELRVVETDHPPKADIPVI